MEYLLTSIVVGTLIIGLLILAYKVLSYVFSLLVPVARSAENVIISTLTVAEEVSIALKEDADEWAKREQDSRKAKIAQNERDTAREEYKAAKARKEAQRIRQGKLDAYDSKKAAKARAIKYIEYKAMAIKSDLDEFESDISEATTVAEVASIIRKVSKSNIPLFTAYKAAHPIYFPGKSLDVKAILANDDVPF